METLALEDKDYERLEQIAHIAGKSAQALIHEWLDRLESQLYGSPIESKLEITQEIMEWSDFSLAQAMRGMEEEPDLYTRDDIKIPY